MRNFKDLNAEEKKKAIDHYFKAKAIDLVVNGSKYASDSVKAKAKSITVKNMLCGCYACQQLIVNTVKADNEMKEYILSEAKANAEKTFYADPDDLIL